MSKLEYENNEIWEYSRDNNDGERIVKKHSFVSYFYILEGDYVPEDDIQFKRENSDVKNLFGKKLDKLTFNNYADLREFAKRLKDINVKTFEADLKPENRFRIDNKTGNFTVNNQRIMYIDIETQDLNLESENEIISLVIYDNYIKKYIAYVWRTDLNNNSSSNIKFNHQNKDFCVETKKFNNEKDMLKSFLDDLIEMNPDIISGWNVDSFDIPYIINRLEKNKISKDALSSIGKVIYKKGKDWKNVILDIKGRTVFDLFKAYKKIHENELDSYKLENVAQEELGYGKTEESGALAKDLWQTKIRKLIIYNIVDVVLLVELNQKIKLFNFFFDLANFVNSDLSDVLQNSRNVDNYLLTYCRNKKIALPSKEFKRFNGIEGAFVLKPNKGLKQKMGIFDLQSLYPNIMRSFNMSPETVRDFMDFNREKKGLVPTVLENLFNLRAEYKSKGLDNEQRVVKEIMNSFYGVMLFSGFRLSNENIGKSITHMGRETILATKEFIEKDGKYTVEYADTDSVFVTPLNSKEEAEELHKQINEYYDVYFKEKHGLEKHYFVMEYEDYVPSALFTGVKKRYILKTGENKYKIRGFEVRRSNVPKLAREVQEKVLIDIVEGKDKKYIKKYLSEVKDKFTNNKVNIDDIGNPMGIKKNIEEYTKTMPIHVRAAKYSNEYLNRNFGADDKVKLYYILRVPQKYPKTDVIALESGDEIPEGFILDMKKHKEKCVDNLTDPIFEALGWNMNIGMTLFG